MSMPVKPSMAIRPFQFSALQRSNSSIQRCGSGAHQSKSDLTNLQWGRWLVNATVSKWSDGDESKNTSPRGQVNQAGCHHASYLGAFATACRACLLRMPAEVIWGGAGDASSSGHVLLTHNIATTIETPQPSEYTLSNLACHRHSLWCPVEASIVVGKGLLASIASASRGGWHAWVRLTCRSGPCQVFATVLGVYNILHSGWTKPLLGHDPKCMLAHRHLPQLTCSTEVGPD
jgi:hypothetical protein